MKRMIRAVSVLCAVLLLCPAATATAQETRKSVIPGGIPFGLTMYTNGVVVVNVDKNDESPAEKAGLKENDVITKADGAEITSNEQLRDIITSSEGADIELSVVRGKSPISLCITPKQDEDGNYAAGMWIRDSTAGLGTITYFDENTHSFGALGHGICDRDTGLLLPLGNGKIVEAEISSITKAKKGVAGGLNGFMTDEPIGEMTVNSGYGVYGRYSTAPEGEAIECAFDSEIKTGDAAMVTTLDNGETETYRVTVESLNLSDNTGQNMVIRVADDRLMEKTGGIVQGMSGSPLIQDGRLIGAVTHVFVNSPDKGYGITIENMLDCYDRHGALKE